MPDDDAGAQHPRPRVLALPDKFRGTGTAAEIGAAIAGAAAEAGWDCDVLPISDGGEGLLECFGGPNRVTAVSGPLGDPVRAPWRLDRTRAVIEMAAASGLALTRGRNDAVAASTRGTGELVAAAVDAGATSVIVGVGGSASTDGGSGAVEVLAARGPLDGSLGADVVVAADVRTYFLDAARLFGPQKGADDGQVATLTARLQDQAAAYLARYGVDVRTLPGGGAAGGLAGGLAALGARIRPGFALVAEHLDLAARIAAADLVLTGEGRLDETSLLGKAPVEVVRLCRRSHTPVAMIVGELAPGVQPPARTVSLVERMGPTAAREHTLDGVRNAAAKLLDDYAPVAYC